MEAITSILDKYPHIYVLVDEVYNFVTFENDHVSFASLGNNYAKTITVYSAGKLFCCTGYKIGWSIGPAEITRVSSIYHSVAYDIVSRPT